MPSKDDYYQSQRITLPWHTTAALWLLTVGVWVVALWTQELTSTIRAVLFR